MAVYLGKNKVGMVKKFTPIDRLQWKCDNLKSLAYEFYKYTATDVQPMLDGLDTSNVTDMSYMFCDCKKLKSLNIKHFDTSNVTTMYYMFDNCQSLTSLDVSNFNTSNVTNMGLMFHQLIYITSLDLTNFDTRQVTSMSNMFYNCPRLEFLDLSSFDTSKVENFNNFIYQASKLKSVLGTIDLYSATSANSIIGYGAIQTINFKNIRISLTIGNNNYGKNLTLDTLINTIKELWDYSSGTTTYKLTMSPTSKGLIANTYVKLIDVTDEMLAQDQYAANKMPCVVCESTDEGAMLITDYATAKGWTIA